MRCIVSRLHSVDTLPTVCGGVGKAAQQQTLLHGQNALRFPAEATPCLQYMDATNTFQGMAPSIACTGLPREMAFLQAVPKIP